jgi:hypothetical protein
VPRRSMGRSATEGCGLYEPLSIPVERPTRERAGTSSLFSLCSSSSSRELTLQLCQLSSSLGSRELTLQLCLLSSSLGSRELTLQLCLLSSSSGSLELTLQLFLLSTGPHAALYPRQAASLLPHIVGSQAQLARALMAISYISLVAHDLSLISLGSSRCPSAQTQYTSPPMMMSRTSESWSSDGTQGTTA